MSELTFCMPVLNGASTIKMALTRIAQQGFIEPRVLINLTYGFDGTLELLNALKLHNWFPLMTMDIFSVPLPSSTLNLTRAGSIAVARQQLVARVTTPFLMFVDCDVLLWMDTVKTALKMMDDATVGMVGIPYDGQEHVQMGATIMRTAIAKELDWDVTSGCDCEHIAKQLNARGLKVLHSPVERAKHVIEEKIG